MLKDFTDAHFGKIYGIDILGSLRLDVHDKLFTVYNLSITVGNCTCKKEVAVSFLPDAETKGCIIKAFRNMIEEIHQTQTRFEIPESVFEEVKE